jgi:hypothetical protein
MARQWIPFGEICAWKDASSNDAALEALKEQGLEIGESVMRQDGAYYMRFVRKKNRFGLNLGRNYGI